MLHPRRAASRRFIATAARQPTVQFGGPLLRTDESSIANGKKGRAKAPEPIAKSQKEDPSAFVREVLTEKPYEKQAAIFKAVARSRRVSVVGCNGSGKDWAAARVVLWWLHSHHPAKAIVTGPTSRQVDDIVWNEIRSAYVRAASRLQGRMFRTSRYEVDEQTFALGFATNSPYNLQGFHSPNLLAVISEAHAVGTDDMDAVRRLNPGLVLMTGNPFATQGVFFDSHHSRRELYETVRISAFDTPNVKSGKSIIPGMITLQDISDRKEEWGEESALYIGSVLGEFPDNLETVVVPLLRLPRRPSGSSRRRARSYSAATWRGLAMTRPWWSGGRAPSHALSGASEAKTRWPLLSS